MAACHALKSSGIPLQSILDQLNTAMGSECPLFYHFVDNQAMIEVVRTGRNPTMRHLGRVHGVSIGFLHEQYRDKNMRMEYITTRLSVTVRSGTTYAIRSISLLRMFSCLVNCLRIFVSM